MDQDEEEEVLDVDDDDDDNDNDDDECLSIQISDLKQHRVWEDFQLIFQKAPI